jgi:hypothetical protein
MTSFSDDPSELQARPYLVTGGRTRARVESLAMETIIVRAAPSHRVAPLASFETGRILDACIVPMSVAEVAARLHLPLTVALVLAGDLVADGLLLASTSSTSQDDVTFIERLIAGVAAL